MENIVIVGAGGFGREVLCYVQDVIQYGKKNWKVKGFLDDNLNALSDYKISDYRIIDRIESYKIEKDDRFICAIGTPKIKKKVVGSLKQRSAVFITLIHPTAMVMERAQIGEGSIVAHHSVIGPDVILGDFVTVNGNCGIGHDARIGSWSVLCSYCDVTGFCELGEGVFLGSKASITPGKKVGEDASVSAGAIVFKNVKAGTTVFGNPAKKLY